MCDCVDVEIGTYANAVALYPPPELGMTRVPVTVDRCIADEVKHLWSLGIVTTGNCCGHNKVPAYIGVREDFIPRMKELGYEVRPNECRPGDEDGFYAKSVARMPRGVCYDCRRPYCSFPDLLVPDAVWAIISPIGHEGGLLCPTCIAIRCEAAGLENVPAAFASGALRSVPYRDRQADEQPLAFLQPARVDDV